MNKQANHSRKVGGDVFVKIEAAALVVVLQKHKHFLVDIHWFQIGVRAALSRDDDEAGESW